MKNIVILQNTNIVVVYNTFVDKLLAESSEFQEKDSGWTWVEIKALQVCISIILLKVHPILIYLS